MPLTSPISRLPYPVLSDPANIETAVKPLVEAIDPRMTPGAAEVPTVRSLGTEGRQSAAGNDSRLVVGAANVATVRRVGTGATEAAPGNDTRFFATGDVRFTARTNTAPTGWIFCNGEALRPEQAERLALREALLADGSPFGRTAEGHPLLPEPRGRAIVAAGQGSGLTNRVHGTTGGTETHSHTAVSLVAADHAHGIAGDGSHAHSMGTANRGTASHPSLTGANEGVAYTNHIHGINEAGFHAHGGATAGSGGVGVTGAVSTISSMQPWMALNMLIKL